MMDDSNDLFSGLPAARNSDTETNEDAAKTPVAAAANVPANANVQPKPAAVAAVTPPAPVSPSGDDYGASSIRVLEGLEPVRMRPGMYIGGTDEKALHHLFAEVIDNSMDEAVAGHANFIEVHLDAEGFLTVTDNGRGIPVENHPGFPASRRSKSS